MIKDHNPELSSRCMRIIECDTARISKVGDTLFLIIGYEWNTKDDTGQWIEIDKDGNLKERDWDYVQEKVVASGKTESELIKSAEEYKKLCRMTIFECLLENIQDIDPLFQETVDKHFWDLS